MGDDVKQDALRRFQVAEFNRKLAAKLRETDNEACCAPETAASPDDILIHGMAVLYDTPSGDGRMIRSGALTWDLDVEGVPIIWDREDGDHSGMVLGRLDTAEDVGTGVMVTGRLFGTDDPVAKAAVARTVELVAENAVGWSIMLDNETVEVTIKDPDIVESDGETLIRYSATDDMAVVTSGRLRHLAIVDTPAFPGARPVLGALDPVAASVGYLFPSRHFDRWESRDPVPLQVDSDGRIWGHAAGDGCFRDGNTAMCKKYTADPDPQMRNFHTGTATLDNGEVIRVGVLTHAGLHAPTTNWDVLAQRQHHENSTKVYAKVRAWNDSRGRLCVAGSLIPGLSESERAQVAGLPVSFEAWPVAGVRGLTLVGIHAVPTPALPVGV